MSNNCPYNTFLPPVTLPMPKLLPNFVDYFSLDLLKLSRSLGEPSTIECISKEGQEGPGRLEECSGGRTV